LNSELLITFLGELLVLNCIKSFFIRKCTISIARPKFRGSAHSCIQQTPQLGSEFCGLRKTL